jgi:hypothetical protein
MTTEGNFLLIYGLHNFVSSVTDGERPLFTICRQADPKMVRHAKSLIAGSYGRAADIQLA